MIHDLGRAHHTCSPVVLVLHRQWRIVWLWAAELHQGCPGSLCRLLNRVGIARQGRCYAKRLERGATLKYVLLVHVEIVFQEKLDKCRVALLAGMM